MGQKERDYEGSVEVKGVLYESGYTFMWCEKPGRPFTPQYQLPHQIVGHFEIGVRIFFVLLFLTQCAV